MSHFGLRQALKHQPSVRGVQEAKRHARLHHCLFSESKNIAAACPEKKTGSLSFSAGFTFFSALLHPFFFFLLCMSNFPFLSD